MSSVLIGIIGVALFMGIAIGSAIFLGPRFEDAQAQSLGSSAIQTISAVGSSVSSFRMATGYAIGPGLESPQKLVDAGFMRQVPINPVTSARPIVIVDETGQTYDGASAAAKPTWSPKAVLMSLGGDSSVCEQILRMTGAIGNGSTIDPSNKVAISNGIGAKMAGCFRTNVATPGVLADDYVAYSRLGA
jgi:hypothetical protein